MRSRAGKAEHVEGGVYPAEVSAVVRLSPHLCRVTVRDRSLCGFADDGPDQRFKLLLPRDGQPEPVMPRPGTWWEDWQAMPADVRPVMRTYTIRAARPERGEVDIDFALHGDTGPGTRWANRARPGDRVGLIGAYAEYEVPVGTRCQVVAGDLTALPAIGAIVERLTGEQEATVLVEVPDPADRIPLDGGPADVRWVTAVPHRPGAALVEAVRALPAWPQPAYAWFAADQATAGRLRRHAVRDRGLRPDQVMFMGYWRTDGPIDPD